MDTTIFRQLSSVIQKKLPHVDVNELLDSLDALSGVPHHPYEKAKYMLLGENYTFPTIDNLPTPEDFNATNCMCQLTSIMVHTQQCSLSSLSAYEQKCQEGYTPSLTGDEYLLDESLIKLNIEFSEIVKSMTLQDIQTKPMELVQKLSTYYINNYNKLFNVI